MKFYPEFEIRPKADPLGFQYGQGVFGPQVENRTLDSIRKNLRAPHCQGPEIVYSIAMDVGNEKYRAAMLGRNLLYGAVTYAKGKLGEEPVRSQGHIHAVSPSCGMSTCEVYEIWSGAAYIYMQETAGDNPGRCYAVLAYPGEVVIVPPPTGRIVPLWRISHKISPSAPGACGITALITAGCAATAGWHGSRW